MRAKSIFLVSWLLLLGTACGGAVPSMSGTRESGQSGLMDDTFAGKNKCSPENHLRPFIIEWDATDMGSFEQFAANDVVVVKYEGCNLQILDRCRIDAAPGKLGAYKPVEWTSGSLETIDIHNEGELTAKLPLGVATLSGRVAAGEKFHMEYFVAGTRSATRPDVYSDDLAKLPGCEGATHFVYNYNLGAFGLGSVQNFDAEAQGSMYGFGASGSTSKGRSAEKKGGDLEVCKSDAIEEVQGCKAPIRLTLRTITKGKNPDATKPDTDESLNAAAMLEARVEMSDEAKARFDAAKLKLESGDGAGCLMELDIHDKLNPKAQSTDPKSGKIAGLRGECLMASGQCALGRSTWEKAVAATKPEIGPDRIATISETVAGQRCKGGGGNERIALIGAAQTLTKGGFVQKLAPKECLDAVATIARLKDKVKPKDEDDLQVKSAGNHLGFNGAKCLAKAGDCEAAWQTYRKHADDRVPADEAKARTLFETLVPTCKK
ncbi:MAG: hypothetical protein KC731_14985 [Myxococcales bacterium]|nr:hypothetical protein [Myxococcales bacterium]